MPADVLRDRPGRSSGAEDLGDPHALEVRGVLVRNRPADKEQHVPHLVLAQHLAQLLGVLHVRTREAREPEHGRVLVDHGAQDRLGGLEDAGVDDLHPGVAQRARHDLGAAVVTVEARLRDDDFYRHGSLHYAPQNTLDGGCSPHTWRSTSQIFPTVARARTASSMNGMRFVSSTGASRSIARRASATRRPSRDRFTLDSRSSWRSRTPGSVRNSSIPPTDLSSSAYAFSPITRRVPSSSLCCCSHAESAIIWFAKPLRIASVIPPISSMRSMSERASSSMRVVSDST